MPATQLKIQLQTLVGEPELRWWVVRCPGCGVNSQREFGTQEDALAGAEKRSGFRKVGTVHLCRKCSKKAAPQ